jgi:hypothetical protein
VIAKIENGVIVCCGSHRPFYRRDGHAPLCRVAGDEVYRFEWVQAFGEHATICIVRRGEAITVDRSYHQGMFNKAERFEAMLTLADWRRVQDALIAANFWSLPPFVQSQWLHLDGYDVIVEGRLRDIFRATQLFNPDVDELWRLCRVAFDVAGLTGIRL